MKSKKLLLPFEFFAVSFVGFVIWVNVSCGTHVGGLPNDSEVKEYTISTWNLGHFSLGKKPYSLIEGKNFGQNLKAFQSVLYDSIDADIICFNEYSDKFGKDETGRIKVTEDLLNRYPKKVIGSLLGYSCNCIFSKIRIEDPKRCEFEINKTVGDKMPRANKCYYVESDLYLGNVKVKLICAHTINSATALCQSQIAELIVKYRSTDKIIMCGDWNTTDFSLFVNSGYTLANDGSFKTYIGRAKHLPIDNIAVRGLRLSNVHMVQINVSDHCPLICKISL